MIRTELKDPDDIVMVILQQGLPAEKLHTNSFFRMLFLISGNRIEDEGKVFFGHLAAVQIRITLLIAVFAPKIAVIA